MGNACAACYKSVKTEHGARSVLLFHFPEENVIRRINSGRHLLQAGAVSRPGILFPLCRHAELGRFQRHTVKDGRVGGGKTKIRGVQLSSLCAFPRFLSLFSPFQEGSRPL